MIRLWLTFALITLSMGQFTRPLVLRPYLGLVPYFGNYPQRMQNVQLCTYSNISYEKCIYTVSVARNNSIPFALECVRQNTRENCINAVKRGIADMVVLTGHGYKKARRAGLRPLIFARENDESLYIAVAPRNITFVEVQEAPIYFDHSDHRAFHAATFFNLRMGHNICNFLNHASMSSYISIVDAAKYMPSFEEILICPDRVPGEFENYKNCNVEAGLQRAVFVRLGISAAHEQAVRKIFQTIADHFESSSQNFKFFDTFRGQDDVIFKKNTISFDFVPTYRNGVDESVYNELHCNNEEQPHDPRVLL